MFKSLINSLLICYCLLVNNHGYFTLGQQTTNLKENQAVSPPPSIFDFLPFRPSISVSKFPPIIEMIAQRIQMQFSNYIYEDLSRPPTYDRPTYKPYVFTLPTSTIIPTTIKPQNEEDITTTTTEALVIPTVSPPQLVLVDSYDVVQSNRINTTIQIEYVLKKINKLANFENTEDKNGNANMISFEKEVATILLENKLKENVTHVFEKQEQEKEAKDNHFVYKEVSTLFMDRNSNSIINYLLRSKTFSSMKSRHFIALTQIGRRIFINTIHFKCQGDNLSSMKKELRIIIDSSNSKKS